MSWFFKKYCVLWLIALFQVISYYGIDSVLMGFRVKIGHGSINMPDVATYSRSINAWGTPSQQIELLLIICTEFWIVKKTCRESKVGSVREAHLLCTDGWLCDRLRGWNINKINLGEKCPNAYILYTVVLSSRCVTRSFLYESILILLNTPWDETWRAYRIYWLAIHYSEFDANLLKLTGHDSLKCPQFSI